MKSNSKGHARRSIRIPGYDYAQPGAYFVTICTFQHKCLFGVVVDGAMQLNEYGEIVQFTWQDLINHIQGIELGEFVVMPNHTHAIIHITGGHVGAGFAEAGSVGAGSKPAQNHAMDDERAGHGPAPTNDATDFQFGSVGAGSKPAQTDDAKILRAGHGPAPTKNMGDIRAGHGPAPTINLGDIRAGHGPAPTKNLGDIRAGNRPAPTKQKPLSEIVRELKTFSARRINALRGTPGLPVWQRNYYEHIIRNEDDLQTITDYIQTNPLNWAADELNNGNTPEMLRFLR